MSTKSFQKFNLDSTEISLPNFYFLCDSYFIEKSSGCSISKSFTIAKGTRAFLTGKESGND